VEEQHTWEQTKSNKEKTKLQIETTKLAKHNKKTKTKKINKKKLYI
jgi:hypothetical protein